MTQQYVFGGLELDKTVSIGKDIDWFRDLVLQAPTTKFVLLKDGHPLINHEFSDVDWYDAKRLEALGIKLSEHLLESCILLGQEKVDDKSFVVGVNVLSFPHDTVKEFEANKSSFAAPRKVMLSSIKPATVAAIGLALALFKWRGINRFCGRCGGPMSPVDCGTRVKCLPCDFVGYPRLDPVVIMAIVSKDRTKCLLGRGRHFPKGMYTCLAGFVDQSECIEDAVRREVFEETGIKVSCVEYHSSQAWPIGRGNSSELMLGCFGIAESDEIKIDPHELEDARWFTREEIAAVLPSTPNLQTKSYVSSSFTAPPVGPSSAEPVVSPFSFIPPPAAIAHHLIRYFVNNNPLPFFAKEEDPQKPPKAKI